MCRSRARPSSSRLGNVEHNTAGGFYAYRASKAALHVLNTSLAVDLKDQRIASVLLHPGCVRTAMTSRNGRARSMESVKSMAQIIDNVQLDRDSGKLLCYQGQAIP